MKTHVFKGSKQEIAASLVRISGEIREAIVFEDEPVATIEVAISDSKDIFAEMVPFMIDGREVDDSREAIYTRLDGE